MADKFHEWWDKTGYTCKDIDKYKIAKKAWNAALDAAYERKLK